MGDRLSLRLVVWDLAGADEMNQMTRNYLRGASGYLVVADGTKRVTWERAVELRERVAQAIGFHTPFVLAVNKSDLKTTWEISGRDIDAIRSMGWEVFATSARTGENVEALFLDLAGQLVKFHMAS